MGPVYNKKAILFFKTLWPVCLLLSLAETFGFSFVFYCKLLVQVISGHTPYTGGLAGYEQELLLVLCMVSMILTAAFQQNPVPVVRRKVKK